METVGINYPPDPGHASMLSSLTSDMKTLCSNDNNGENF